MHAIRNGEVLQIPYMTEMDRMTFGVDSQVVGDFEAPSISFNCKTVSILKVKWSNGQSLKLQAASCPDGASEASSS